MTRGTRIALATAPGLVLAGFGLVHPAYLARDTATAWWQLHVPLVVLFPLLAGAVWVLLHGVRGPVAALARIAAYAYACLYIALDTVSGIAAGLAYSRLGDTPLVGDLFSVGDPLGHLGVAFLATASVLTAAARYRTDGPLVLPGTAVALVAAWAFYRFHLFSPYGVLAMVGFAVGFGLVAAAARPRTPLAGS